MIEIAAICGFCKGSENAFNTALKTVKDNPGRRAALFKRLLHNNDVVEALEKRGAVKKDAIEDFETEDFENKHIVVIRAHGEPKETFEYFDRRGLEYVDCTCPKVKRIHNLIAEKHGGGYQVVIIGNKAHPEVTGSNGWCDNAGIIAAEPEDIDAGDIPGQKIFVVVQTTFNREKFQEISKKLREKYQDRLIEITDTLCDAMEKNHRSSVELAARCKTMLVIGDKDSANTEELYRKCKAACPDVRQIEGRRSFYDGIIGGHFDFSAAIGITGGASTPVEIIYECKQLLEFKKFYEEAAPKIKEKIAVYTQLLLRDNNPLFARVMEQFAEVARSEKAKLLRGCLIALGYKMTRDAGAPYDYSIDLAAAYELFETAILVHDDVFDKAGERRGVSTVHRKTADDYSAEHRGRKELIDFNALSLAVCAGDLGFYFLNQMILAAYKNDSRLAAVLECFNNIVITTIKGEMLDIALSLEERLAEGRPDMVRGKNIESGVLEIDTLKTAEYTTIGPLCLGLTLGGAEKRDMEKIAAMLTCLGIAFQAKDDWLNIYGTPEQGKPLCNDISEFKMTFFYSEACKNGKTREELLKYYGREDLSPEDIEAVKRIFEVSGARKKVESVIFENIKKCRELLREIEFKNREDEDILRGLVLFLELRSR